jgi:2-haloacid dehalogenase
MLEANVQSAGLSGFFEQVLSTDRAKSYKPDPRAYQLGTEALKLERQEILFVAFAGWDAAGAKVLRLSYLLAQSPKAAGGKIGCCSGRRGRIVAAIS